MASSQSRLTLSAARVDHGRFCRAERISGVPDTGSTPQLEAPTLAEIARQIDSRPLWQVRDQEPIEVDPDTFDRARNEMREVQERQGRSVARASWVTRENFLLRGIPVVRSNDL